MRTLAICLTATALLTGPALADVFIPKGDADSVLHLEDDGSVIGRIEGLENVHGLALAPESGSLVAGSLSQAKREPGGTGVSGTMARPEGRREAEHERHHMDGDAVSEAVSGVSLVDADTQAVTRRVEVPGMVHHVAVDAAERHAVVTHPGLGSVSIIDLETGEVTATVATGPDPEYADADPETGRFFVSSAGNATISELDPEAGIVTRNIRLGAGQKHLQLVPGSRTLVAPKAMRARSRSSTPTPARSPIGSRSAASSTARSPTARRSTSARERGRVVAIDLATRERTEAAAVAESPII